MDNESPTAAAGGDDLEEWAAATSVPAAAAAPKEREPEQPKISLGHLRPKKGGAKRGGEEKPKPKKKDRVERIQERLVDQLG